MKQCTKCKDLKSLNEFGKDKTTKSGLCYQCKKCKGKYGRTHKIEMAGYKKKYRRSEKGKLKGREQGLRSKFGITLKQYDEMFEQQNGVCLICGSAGECYRRLAVDHNHKTGKIRALLCSNCNNMIGLAKENVIILQSAINYLKSFET